MCKDIIEPSPILTRLMQIASGATSSLVTKVTHVRDNCPYDFNDDSITTTTMTWDITPHKHLKAVLTHFSRSNETYIKLCTINTKGWLHRRTDIDTTAFGQEYSQLLYFFIDRAKKAEIHNNIKKDVAYTNKILNELRP